MFNSFASFLGNLYHGASNAVRGGLSATHILPAAPKQAPKPAPVQAPVPSLGQFLATHLAPAAQNIDNSIVNVARPVIKAINGNPVAKFAGQVGNAAAGDVNHLAKVISYPINVAQYEQMAKKGQLTPEQTLQLEDQAGEDAGFKQKDKGLTVLRKSAGAVAGPTAAILTSGLAPGAVAGVKGLSLGARVAQGAKFGAKIGGLFGGINTLNQDKVTPLSAAESIGGGTAVGAGGGALAPLAGAGGKIVIKGIKNGSGDAIKILQSESGHLGMGGSELGPVEGGIGPGKQKTTRYAGTTVPESDLVSEPIRTTVKAEAPKYTVQTEKAGLNKAAIHINNLGPDAAIADVQKRLNVPNGHVSRQDVIDAQAVAAGLDARGGDVAHQQAADIYKSISSHLNAQGASVQAARMLSRRTPEGLKFQAISDLRKAGVEVTPELGAKIDQHIDEFKQATGAGKGQAVAKLSKTILKNTPKSAAENAISVWKAGLLSGVKTQGGNFASNGTFGLLKKASDVPAAIVDKGISLVTGKRAKTFNGNVIDTGKAFVGGIGKGFGTMKTGIDERNIGADGKYEQGGEINFKHPVIQKIFGDPANFVFRGMSAADQPFYYGAFRDNLRDAAKAEGLTNGLHGADLKAHIDQSLQNPSPELAQIAEDAAKKAVLAHTTIAGRIVPGIKQAIDHTPGASEAGKTTAKAIVDILAPFSKVPSAFISRVVDFTPAGPLKTVFSQIAHRQFDQRALSEALGEATTGTAVIALGYKLAQNNLLSGDYPKNDPKQIALWKAEHITPNSVNVGGHWISLNYLGPVGLLFGAAKNLQQTHDSGHGNEVASALAGLGSGLMGQSFLQGFSGFADAINDPQRSAKTFVNSEAGSVIPSWLSDVANVTDQWQRQSNSALDTIKSRLPFPFARESLAPKIDTFGNDLQQPSTGGSAINLNQLNPLKPSDDNHTPLLSELDRLSSAGHATVPVVATTIGAGDTKIILTPQQSVARQKLVGSQVTPLWNQIISSPDYAKLDDAHKSQALQNALTDINSAADRTLTAQIDSSKLKKPATGNTALILSGHGPTADDYLTKATAAQTKVDSATGGSTPAEKYQAALTKYQADKAAGKLSSIEDSKARTSLARQKVTSAYSQDVIDFYGLSKKQAAAYVAGNPDDGAKLYAQAKELDSKLGGTKYKYGLSTKNGGTKKVKVPKLTATKAVKIPKVASIKGAKPTKLKLPRTTRAKTAKVASGKKIKLTLA